MDKKTKLHPEIRKLVLNRIAVLQAFLRENATRPVGNIKEKRCKSYRYSSQNLLILEAIMHGGQI